MHARTKGGVTLRIFMRAFMVDAGSPTFDTQPVTFGLWRPTLGNTVSDFRHLAIRYPTFSIRQLAIGFLKRLRTEYISKSFEP